MRKFIAIVILFLSLACGNGNNESTSKATAPTTDSVYICNSSGAVAYHKYEGCGGLQRCTHGILKVALSDAKSEYGRRACRKCY